MGFIATVLIIIIFCAYILPQLAGVLLRWFVKRKTRQMFDSFTGADPFGRQQTGSGRATSGRTRNGYDRVPKKKIGKDVGEYVDFEEISVTQTTATDGDTTSTDTSVNYTREQQITDVDWEEV